MSDAIIARFGGDTTGLRKATEEGAIILKGFSRQASTAFREIGAGFVGAVLVMEAIRGVKELAKEAIDGAQKTRDEFYKTGQQISQNTLLIAAFGDRIDSLKDGAKAATNVVIAYGEAAIRILQQAHAVMYGDFIDFAAKDKAAADAAKKAADDRAFAEENSVKKIEAANEKLANTLNKNREAQLEGQAKINLMVEEYNNLVDTTLALDRNTVAYRERLVQLSDMGAKIDAETAKQRKAESDQAAKDGKEEQALFDEQLSSAKKIADEKARLAKAAEAQRLAEASITSEFQKQLILISKMAGGGKPGFVADANGGHVASTTVSELDNQLRNAQNAFDYIKQNPNAAGYSNDYIAARDLVQKTQADLDYAKRNTSTIGSGYSGGVPLGNLPSQQILSFGDGIDLRKAVGATVAMPASPSVVKMGDDVGEILDTLTTLVGGS